MVGVFYSPYKKKFRIFKYQKAANIWDRKTHNKISFHHSVNSFINQKTTYQDM